MSLHIHPILPDPVPEPSLAGTVETVFFVIQRQNGHWSPASKILHVMEKEWQAEDMAQKLKEQHPQQNYGVAMLRSEAQVVPNPIAIVRATDAPEQEH